MATLRLCTDPPRSTHCTPYGLHVHLLPLKWCFTVASEGGIWSPGLSVTRRKASASATFLSNTFKGSSYTWRKQACVSSYINNGTLTLAHSKIRWKQLETIQEYHECPQKTYTVILLFESTNPLPAITPYMANQKRTDHLNKHYRWSQWTEILLKKQRSHDGKSELTAFSESDFAIANLSDSCEANKARRESVSHLAAVGAGNGAYPFQIGQHISDWATTSDVSKFP